MSYYKVISNVTKLIESINISQVGIKILHQLGDRKQPFSSSLNATHIQHSSKQRETENNHLLYTYQKTKCDTRDTISNKQIDCHKRKLSDLLLLYRVSAQLLRRFCRALNLSLGMMDMVICTEIEVISSLNKRKMKKFIWRQTTQRPGLPKQ